MNCRETDDGLPEKVITGRLSDQRLCMRLRLARSARSAEQSDAREAAAMSSQVVESRAPPA
jgi:hypothetical protein